MVSPIQWCVRSCAALGAAACMIASGAFAAGPAAEPAPSLADYDVSKLTLGGDFTLTDQNGKLARFEDLRGRVVVMFFGYTYCPDVCPATLAKIARTKKGLEKLGGRLQPVMVTIDPARDTPARLRAYLRNFNAGAIGLTGTPAEVERAAGLYRVRYEKEDGKSPSGYLMSHTAYVYVVDRGGKLRYVFPPDVDDGLLAEAARRLLNG